MSFRSLEKFGIAGGLILVLIGAYLLNATIPIITEGSKPVEYDYIEGQVSHCQFGYDIAAALEYPDDGENAVYLNFEDAETLLEDEKIYSAVNRARRNRETYRFKLDKEKKIYRLYRYTFQNALREHVEVGSTLKIALKKNWEEEKYLPIRYIQVDGDVIAEGEEEPDIASIIGGFGLLLSLGFLLSGILIIFDKIKERKKK